MQNLSKVSKELNKDEAFKLDQDIKNLRTGAISDFWKMVRKLGWLREYNGWHSLGYDSWASYLAQPEIDYSEETMEDYIEWYVRIYKYIKNGNNITTNDILKFDPLNLKFDTNRARLLTPRANSENIQELISKAESLSYGDFEAEMMDEREKKNKKDGKDPSWLKLYNIWSFGKPDPRWGYTHPGQIPGQIMANMLYYYTQEGDQVVDPFGGGGSTLDVCRDFNRKCWTGDIDPKRGDIEKWDITQGFPDKLKDVQLVFLDPPYAMVNKGKYTGEGNDLSNMELDTFYKAIEKIVIESKEILKLGGYLGLIIGGTSEISGGADFAIDCFNIMNEHLTPVRRVLVPYTTQNYRPDQVADCKEKKYMLNLVRDLLIFKK